MRSSSYNINNNMMDAADGGSKSVSKESNGQSNSNNNRNTVTVSSNALMTLERDNFELKTRADKITRDLARANHVMKEHKLGGASVPNNTVSAPDPYSGKNDIDDNNNDTDEVNLLGQNAPWARNATLMAPLIHSYEDRIKELEYTVTRGMGLAEQAQDLASENDLLRDQVADAVEHLANLQAEGLSGQTAVQLQQSLHACEPGGGGSNTKVKARAEEEKEEFEQLYKLSIEQNGVLAQQNVLLKSQIDKMQTAVQQSTVRSQEDSRQVIEAAKSCQSLEVSLTEHTKTREQMEAKLQVISKDLATVNNANKELQKRVDETSKEVRESKRQAENMRDNYNEKKVRLEQESRSKSEIEETSEKEITEKAARNRELQSINVELSEKAHKLNRENNVMRSELQNVLSMVEALEQKEKLVRSQLSEACAKLEKGEQDLSELELEKSRLETMESLQGRTVGSAIINAQNSTLVTNSNGQQSDRDIIMGGDVDANLFSASYDDPKNIQALEKLQKAILDATQGQIDQRQKMSEELEEKLLKLSETNVDLQTRCEGLQKQAEFESSSLNAQLNALAQQSTEQGQDLNDLHDTKIALEKEVTMQKSDLRELRKALDTFHCRTTAEMKNRTKESNILSKSMEQARQQLQGSTNDKELLEQQKQKLSQKLEVLERERIDLRSRQTETLRAEKLRFDEERQNLVRKLNNLQTITRDREQEAVDLLRKQEELRSQWKDRLSRENVDLKRQVDRLKTTLMSYKMGATLQSAIAYTSLEQSMIADHK